MTEVLRKSKDVKAAAKQARLKAALRANLVKRKMAKPAKTSGGADDA